MKLAVNVAASVPMVKVEVADEVLLTLDPVPVTVQLFRLTISIRQ